MFALDGRTALLTGSARGLGLEMARGLARAGAQVVLNGRDPGRLDQAAALANLRTAADLLSDSLRSHLSYEERELVEPIARLGFA